MADFSYQLRGENIFAQLDLTREPFNYSLGSDVIVSSVIYED